MRKYPLHHSFVVVKSIMILMDFSQFKVYPNLSMKTNEVPSVILSNLPVQVIFTFDEFDLING